MDAGQRACKVTLEKSMQITTDVNTPSKSRVLQIEEFSSRGVNSTLLNFVTSEWTEMVTCTGVLIEIEYYMYMYVCIHWVCMHIYIVLKVIVVDCPDAMWTSGEHFLFRSTIYAYKCRQKIFNCNQRGTHHILWILEKFFIFWDV